MPRNYKTVNQLIEQGYMIIDANTKYAGEAWELTPELVALFNPAFLELRTAQAAVENIRIEKEAAVKRAQLERDRIEHSIARLKQYILVVADKDTAETMFHTLGIDENLPNKDEDLVTKLMSTVVPHLADWDGTPQEIDAATKTEVTDGTNEFADAVRDSIEKQAESTTATQDRDNKRDTYEDVLTRIRNWLYLRLPEEKYDSRLDEYGFEVWDLPGSGGGNGGEEPGSWEEKPTDFAVREGVSESAVLTAIVNAEADGVAVFMVDTELGIVEPPPVPVDPTEPKVPFSGTTFSYELSIATNRRVWFWICHVKDGEHGEKAGPVWIEIIK